MTDFSSRIIICAGAFRSGSTWLFNAARLILLESGSSVASYWIDDFRAIDAQVAISDFILLKIHDANEDLASKAWRILTSHRDLRDVARSASDFLGAVDPAVFMNSAETAMNDHRFWVQHADYDLHYESMVKDPKSEVLGIARALEISITTDKAESIARTLKELPEPQGSDRFDSTTLLHPTHRFGGTVGAWRDRIPQNEVKAIEDRFAAWMIQYGYLDSPRN